MFAKKEAAAAAAAAQPSPSLPQEPDIPLPSKVEDVMYEISRGWDFMTQEDFNPVTLALDLLDTAHQSRDVNKFEQLLEKLENAMDFIVNDHYQAFNNSIETFGRVTESIADSQQKVSALRENLLRCKSLLLCRRPDLMELWVKSVQYKEMLRMLETIEELKKAPERVELLVQKKHYLKAVKLLLSSLKTLNGSDYGEVAALSDIRASLIAMRNSLHEAIIEDLHRFVYMKSNIFGSKAIVSLFDDKQPEARFARKGRQSLLHALTPSAQRLKAGIKFKSSTDEEDSEYDPEANPLKFIELMLIALDLLEKLGDAATIIKQRLPYELFKTIDKVTREVEEECGERGYSILMEKRDIKSIAAGKSLSRSTISSYVFESLLKRLYLRLHFVMEIHQYTIERLAEITQREVSKLPSSSQMKYTLTDLWSSVQQEVSLLLTEYLTDSNRSIAPSEIKMDVSKGKNYLDKKNLFRFASSSSASTFHPVVNGTASNENSSAGIVDYLMATNEVTGHKLIIRPTILNLSVAIKPSIDFVESAQTSYNIRNDKKSDIITLLDTYLLKKFLPQLEDTVVQRFHESVNSVDSYRLVETDEPDVMIMKAAYFVSNLLKDLCFAVYKIPVHQPSFISIIETMLTKFLEKITIKFQNTIVSDGGEIDDESAELLSRKLVEDQDMINLVTQNTYLTPDKQLDTSLNDSLSKREFSLEQRILKDRAVMRAELLFDKRKVEFLANLRVSLSWFIRQLESMRKAGNFTESKIDLRPFSEVISHSKAHSELDLLSDGYHDKSEDDIPEELRRSALCLALDEQTDRRFTDLTTSFTKLAQTCIILLRKELRVHFLYFIDLALREGNYASEDQVIEPEPNVMALNQDLVGFQQVSIRSLPENEQRFVFDGLAILAANVLLNNARTIKRLTRMGALKMLKNIQAIQQSLSSVSLMHEQRLDKARQYYQLFLQSGEEIIQSIEDNGAAFSYEEYLTLFKLKYQHELTIPEHPLIQVYETCCAQLKKLCPK